MEKLKETAEGVQLKIRVQPRASKNQVVGWLEDALKVRLTAPPVDGEANAALQRFLADYFGIPRSEVELLTGATGRTKVIRLNGMTAAEVAKRVNCVNEKIIPKGVNLSAKISRDKEKHSLK